MKRLLITLLLVSHSLSASVLSDLAAGMSPGEWVAMPSSSSLNSLPVGPLMFFSGKASWDAANQRVIWIAGPGSCCADPPTFQRTMYTAGSDTWSQSAAPFSGSGHAYDSNAFDSDNGIAYVSVSTNRDIRSWNGSSWGSLPNIPWSNGNIAPANVYFPDWNGGAGGLVHVGGLGKHAVYSGGSWTSTRTPSGTKWGTYHNFANYNPGSGKVWMGAGSGGSTINYTMTSTGSLSQGKNAPFNLGPDNASIASAPGTDQFIIHGSGSGFWSYDVSSNNFQQLSGEPSFANDMFMVTIEDHGVIMVFDKNKKVYLYRHAATTPPVVDTSPPAQPTNLTAD